MSTNDITEGESLDVSCTLPIDYRGGDCRLFRKHSDVPFKVMTATEYVCVFHLSSKVLLGQHPVGSMISIRCDYRLQEYTSVSSDSKNVIVWGTRPSPSLSISRRFVSHPESIEVICSPPAAFSKCIFYKGQYEFTQGSCSRNITGKELAIWEKPSLLLPLNITCTYDPDIHRYIRSEHSNHLTVFVVDASRVASLVDCKVSVSDDQLEALRGSSWATVGANGGNVTIQVTNSSLSLGQTCN
ncbi:uncharacterized protein [Leuresthes tenuis]